MTDQVDFYDDEFRGIKIDPALVDNGTTYVTVPTPEGWKCERAGCTTEFIHKHTTYSGLK